MRTFNELRHYGIKGQHWGVRRGPPYPFNSPDRAVGSLALRNHSEEAERRVHMARNIAIATLTGVAVVGAAYMAKKSGLFSKISVSDLADVAVEAKFQSSESTDLIAFMKAVHEMSKLVRDDSELKEKVLQTERDLGDLKNKKVKEILEIARNLKSGGDSP